VTIHEIFTLPWLSGLSADAGRKVTLGDVPAAAWDALALPGTDTIWLMGVWERSAIGRAVALDDPGFRAATAAALPNATDADVVGSAYCIRSYSVDARLGGRDGLAAAREALAQRGLRLVLDFVPNHVAPDHEWVGAHPEFFVRGTAEDLERDPDAWLETAGGVLARGRDPSFPPWPDVVQLDPMSAALRDAVVGTLVDIADQCDAVRCDMAMLFLDEVARRTWAGRLGPIRPEPYWREITRRVHDARPQLLFIAETYWDLEAGLVEQGVDRCYDKRLYDRLRDGDAAAVRSHLAADAAWQQRLVRFLETHDEPRAATVFPRGRLRAAALALTTLPGVILLHEGQVDGLRIRLPVHLGRRPAEKVDPDLSAFWRHLLEVVDRERVRSGDWQLLGVAGWPENSSCENLLAWRWRDHVVVINYGDATADGRVRLGSGFAGRTVQLRDVLRDVTFERDGDTIAADGLYVALRPWEAHVFRLA
jgi:hypothetical protein